MFFKTKKLMFQPSLMLFTDPTPTTPTPNGGKSGIKNVPVPVWIKNSLRIILIFFIGFISRFIINDLFGVDVFRDYLSIVSITYYFHLSGIAFYINQCKFGSLFNVINFKFVVDNIDMITYQNLVVFIDNLIANSCYIGMEWEGFSSLKGYNSSILTMNNHNGVQAGANPQEGVQAGANPQGVQVVANPNIGLLNPSAVPVLDPTNVKTTIMGQLASYQPYATNLANHLDRIRPLNGGRASPIFNNNIYPSDRDWLRTYYQHINRNPNIAQNGINLSRDLKNLP